MMIITDFGSEVEIPSYLCTLNIHNESAEAYHLHALM